jgi:hypothetical protein
MLPDVSSLPNPFSFDSGPNMIPMTQKHQDWINVWGEGGGLSQENNIKSVKEDPVGSVTPTISNWGFTQGFLIKANSQSDPVSHPQ